MISPSKFLIDIYSLSRSLNTKNSISVDNYTHSIDIISSLGQDKDYCKKLNPYNMQYYVTISLNNQKFINKLYEHKESTSRFIYLENVIFYGILLYNEITSCNVSIVLDYNTLIKTHIFITCDRYGEKYILNKSNIKVFQ